MFLNDSMISIIMIMIINAFRKNIVMITIKIITMQVYM